MSRGIPNPSLVRLIRRALRRGCDPQTLAAEFNIQLQTIYLYRGKDDRPERTQADMMSQLGSDYVAVIDEKRLEKIERRYKKKG